MAICNKDCFNCQYPDCVLDELDAEDYRESRQRDRLLKERTDKQRKMPHSRRLTTKPTGTR